jgi:hypothetical protein
MRSISTRCKSWYGIGYTLIELSETITDQDSVKAAMERLNYVSTKAITGKYPKFVETSDGRLDEHVGRSVYREVKNPLTKFRHFITKKR